MSPKPLEAILAMLQNQEASRSSKPELLRGIGLLPKENQQLLTPLRHLVIPNCNSVSILLQLTQLSTCGVIEISVAVQKGKSHLGQHNYLKTTRLIVKKGYFYSPVIPVISTDSTNHFCKTKYITSNGKMLRNVPANFTASFSRSKILTIPEGYRFS